MENGQTEQDRVHKIEERITALLAGMEFIEGIVLGGSRASGTAGEGSDIDIGIYYNPDRLDVECLNQAAKQLDDSKRDGLIAPPGAWGKWVNGGGWLTMDGFPVDLILRDIRRVERVVRESEQGIVTVDYQAGHPHGYVSCMYRGELAVSQVLYAGNDSLLQLKKQAEIYPEQLQKGLTDLFSFEAGFSLQLAKKAEPGGDRYYVTAHLIRFLSCLNQLLFARNRTYCLNEKKAVRRIGQLPLHPEAYERKAEAVLRRAGDSLKESCRLAEELYREAEDL